VCDDHGLTCPGNQPVNVLDCGPPGDCWIGCRDGPLISFADAAMFCASWGGRLGWINSAAEEVCLRQTINGAIILGLTQAAGQSATDSGWSWNGDGLAPVYIDWGTGQPDDANTVEDGTEQCAYSNSSSEWHDTECDVPASARFTCRTASVLSSRASGAAASSDGEID
jgi:hypothetical protein